jgi:HK97 family phage prohead protease
MTTDTRAGRESALQRALEAADKARLGERHHSRLPIVELTMRGESGGTGDGGIVIEGHAATTNSEYVLFEDASAGIRVRERIASTAFDEVLSGNPDVHLNINHDMSKAIARTGVKGVGGLELGMDKTGLKFYARVDRSDPDVVGLMSKMRIGVIDQASFAFTIAEETRTSTEEDDEVDVLYEILRVGELYDVCVCAQGANPQTDSSIRSLAAAVGQPSNDELWAVHRQPVSDLGDVSASPAEAVGVLGSRAYVARAKARARTKRSQSVPKD